VSGVIYAVIVVMWAAFLVPMWLRRRDDAAAEARSVARFSTAMRVLGRRPSMPAASARPSPVDWASEEATVVIKDRGPKATATQALGVRLRDEARAAESARPATPRRHPTRSTSLAARRRRVLLILVGLTVLFGVAAKLTALPVLTVVLPVGLLIAYVTHLRIHARRTADAARRRRAEEAASIWTTPTTTPAPHERASAFDEPAGSAPVLFDLDDATEETVPVMIIGDLAPVDGFAGPRLGWDPVPVPTPTYVDAPTAARPVRTIDLSSPGAWTSGRLVADAAAAAARVASRRESSAESSDDGEESAEQLRAVGD
jgi:hypothetical protein